MVRDLEPEPGVGLVDPEPVHRLPVTHPRDGGPDLFAENVAEDAGHEPFHHPEDVLPVDERHLDVDLRELGLPVGAQVLVAEALDDLRIPVVPGDHQDLLEQLRGLGKGVEHPRVDAGRHQVVPRPLGGALCQHRRLHLEESVLEEVLPHGAGKHRAFHEHRLDRRPPQVEIAVLEADVFGHVGVVLEGEGDRLRFVQDRERGRRHLHRERAGRHLQDIGQGPEQRTRAGAHLHHVDGVGPDQPRLGGDEAGDGLPEERAHLGAGEEVTRLL